MVDDLPEPTHCACCGATAPATRHLEMLEAVSAPTWWRHQVREHLACGLFCAEQLELDADPPETEDHEGPDETLMALWLPVTL